MRLFDDVALMIRSVAWGQATAEGNRRYCLGHEEDVLPRGTRQALLHLVLQRLRILSPAQQYDKT